jgi:hypothetical protein
MRDGGATRRLLRSERGSDAVVAGEESTAEGK